MQQGGGVDELDDRRQLVVVRAGVGARRGGPEAPPPAPGPPPAGAHCRRRCPPPPPTRARMLAPPARAARSSPPGAAWSRKRCSCPAAADPARSRRPPRSWNGSARRRHLARRRTLHVSRRRLQRAAALEADFSGYRAEIVNGRHRAGRADGRVDLQRARAGILPEIHAVRPVSAVGAQAPV
ncbi:hypothetical protein G6F31_013407 [Rhizopus arrhizus]|nr:hypothetical protein G6F31_013407 [Rhizopus arrhizus]